ncbi:DNA primase small subunit-like protein [Blakeslea trispora]|nr:DNA primase small subunit-like protein [Blakeslea trispora]
MTTLQEKALETLKDIEMEDFFDDPMDSVDQEFAKVNIALDQENTTFLYRLFYDSLFPYKTYFHWLNYDTTPTKSFTHREFSFTLPADIYVRFKSFGQLTEFKKEIERLQPIKIDIGPVYSIKPKDKKTVSESAFRPLEKELVFDIDMTDYDEIRTCCSGGDVCMLCWEFMTVAMKIIDSALKDDFGFQHIMWVYSGRRGVHCWVCDERARQLDNETRKAIVKFLDVIRGGSQVQRKVKLPAILHPSLSRSFKVIEAHFESLVLNKMGVLDTPDRWKKLLDIIPDQAIQDRLHLAWSEHSLTAKEKWEMVLKEQEKADKKKKHYQRDPFARDIMFQYCYPRLDVKVSTAINHLLKSPFCVHPKTLRVCVPIQIESCDQFNPLTVPNLHTISQELASTKSEERKDYKKTSLKPYVDYFDKFVMDMMVDTKRTKRDEADRSMTF